MASVIAYHSTMIKLSEQERLIRSMGYIALSYDVALRKSWARRALQRDPELNIHQDCCVINQDILDAVRAQAVAAQAAASGQPPAGRGGAPSSQPWLEASAESTLAKAGAAAQAMTRRAEAASRELQRAEQSLSAREEALQSNGGNPPRNNNRGKGGKNQGKGGKGGKNQGHSSYGGWSAKKRKW